MANLLSTAISTTKSLSLLTLCQNSALRMHRTLPGWKQSIH